MKVIIENCFDWIGFHLTEKYLNEGFEVCGIDELDERKEFLYEMVGRNASFQYCDDMECIDDEMRDATIISIVQNNKDLRELNQNKECYFILSGIDHEDINQIEQQNNSYYIYTPKLIGPWMNKQSYDQYSKEDNFELYIDDFISWLFRLTKTKVKPNVITLQTKKNQRNSQIEKNSQGLMTLIPTTSLDEGRKRVKEHILKYPLYYTNNS
jgi:hypothetical protein